MTARNQNFEVHKGDSHVLAITVINQDDGLKRLSLVDRSVSWYLYKEPHHIPVIEKHSDETSDVNIVDASEGYLKVELSTKDTAKLSHSTQYTHALKVRDSVGHVVTVLTGNVEVKN